MIHERSWKLLTLGEGHGLKLVFASDHRSQLLSVTLEGEGDFEVVGKTATFDGNLKEGRVTAKFTGDTPRLIEVYAHVQASLVEFDGLGERGLEQDMSLLLAKESFERRAVIATVDAPWDDLSDDFKPVWQMTREEKRAMFELRDVVERRIARARRLFHRLERLSHLDEAIPGHEQVYRILNGRIRVRTAYAQMGAVHRFLPMDEVDCKTSIDVSSFLRTLLLAEAREDLPWALELFATERLVAEHPGHEARVLHNQGVPNGADFFKFTEFALLAIEHDIHREFWEHVLVHFVRASQVYAEHAFIRKGLFAYDEKRPRFPLKRIRELRLAYPEDTPVEVLRQRFCSILAQRMETTHRPLEHARYPELEHTVEFPDRTIDDELVFKFMARL